MAHGELVVPGDPASVRLGATFFDADGGAIATVEVAINAPAGTACMQPFTRWDLPFGYGGGKGGSGGGGGGGAARSSGGWSGSSTSAAGPGGAGSSGAAGASTGTTLGPGTKPEGP